LADRKEIFPLFHVIMMTFNIQGLKSKKIILPSISSAVKIVYDLFPIFRVRVWVNP
jgi:hypothetical protein